MELRHLRYFLAVAEERHFTRAAERLGIKQPPLSQQIRQLEEEVGTPLFRRMAREIELTEPGKLLFEDARRILDQVDHAKTRVQRCARGETGRIRVGFAGATYFQPLVLTIIRDYRRLFPSVVLAPEQSNTPSLVEGLATERVDVAFIRPPITDSHDFIVEALVEEDMLAVLPAGHPLDGAAAVPLSALAAETFILFPRAIGIGLYDAIISACHRAGFSPRLGQDAPQITSIVPMVAAGFGVSLVPRSASQIRADGVVYAPLTSKWPKAAISLAYRKNAPSPAVEKFIELAKRMRGGLGSPEHLSS